MSPRSITLFKAHHVVTEAVRNLPSNVGHGTEGIVALSDGDTGHLVHGQHCSLALGQAVHQLWVLSRVDEAHQSGTFLHKVCLVYTQSWVQHGGTNLGLGGKHEVKYI